jgi:hypothetical protein
MWRAMIDSPAGSGLQRGGNDWELAALGAAGNAVR